MLDSGKPHYQCVRCGNCCRWPGDVNVTGTEVPVIAKYLGMEEAAFIEEYTRLNSKRSGLSIIDKPNGECIFLEGHDCRVQPVKPQQCRDFPNGWNFPGFEKFCRAIPREIES